MSQNKQKSQIWGGRNNEAPDKINIEFCAGRDVKSLPMADEKLLEYDIWTNLAHAKMLHKINVLNKSEFEEIKNALKELIILFQKGDFSLDPSKEDVHINIEHYLTREKKIQAGNKIHTGRSRNDQVATDMRLFMRDKTLGLIDNLFLLVNCILNKAEAEKNTVMPGFTHYQPAMLTTAGHWLTNWSQALLRDIVRFLDDFKIMNLSPLGAAASFGTSWKIDRELTAELLGFDAVEENTLDCVNSRGEHEARISASVSLMMNHLSTISQDLILLATPYYDMIKVADKYVTGSSIMPQKRNLDFAEITRSKAAQSHGILTSLLGIQKGSMSGYNRDTQQTKYLIMDLFWEVIDAPFVISNVIKTLTFKKEKMLEQCEKGFINSADIADWLSQEYSLSFREAYNILAKAVNYSDDEGKLSYNALEKATNESGLKIKIDRDQFEKLNTFENLVKIKTHIGAPSAQSVTEMIKNQRKKLSILTDKTEQLKDKIIQAKESCFN